MATSFTSPESVMRRALELAAQGQGYVEPNPMVGAVLVDAELQLLGEGFHQQYGGPHAEVHALAAGTAVADACLFVTLEPCCHHGKTPPCTQAVLDSGIKNVVVATADPAAHAAGQGIEQLRQAGVKVEVGLLQAEAQQLIAPFTKLMKSDLPYVHAKWAMSLDGKIATRTSNSQWISNAASRAIVHQLRGRMDAIIVGAETVRKDDPLLTARPKGIRTATRVIVDSNATLTLDSKLVKTAEEAPVIVACSNNANQDNIKRLTDAGITIISTSSENRVDVTELLNELGGRNMTNVLVEGGGQLLGSLNDAKLIDEVHIFVGAKLIGGAEASGPIGGNGIAMLAESPKLTAIETRSIDEDVYIRGLLRTEN